MAVSPVREKTIDFRAPPPSPVASGRRSTVTNDDILTEFLEQSLRVPDLVLPDRVFPRQKSSEDPPRVDFELLGSLKMETLELIGQIGCCEVVNHGIHIDVIKSICKAGAGVFEILPEMKGRVMRTGERVYGFVEFHGEEEREASEEFVWCRDESLNMEMEAIWPAGYSNFSEEIERLLSVIEEIAGKFLQALKQNTKKEWAYDDEHDEGAASSICYLYKHCGNMPIDQYISSLRYDVIRMLIRGSEYSHALCLHVCDGSSEFHVYSKKGWVSFVPDKDALLITIGDQLQAWSGGQYKHVIGKPIFKGEEDCISMAFLYSPPTNEVKVNKGSSKTISLGEQVILALIFTLIYHVLIYVYKKL